MILPDATKFLAQPYTPNLIEHIKDLNVEQLEVSAAGYFEKASSSLDRGDIESAVQNIARLDSMLNDIFLCLSRNLNDGKGFPDRVKALRNRIARDKSGMQDIGADYDEVLDEATDDLEDTPPNLRGDTPDLQRFFIRLSGMLHPLSHLLKNQYHRLYLPLSQKFPFFIRPVWIDGQTFDRSNVPDMLWLDLTDRAPQGKRKKQVSNADVAAAFAAIKGKEPFLPPVVPEDFDGLVKLADHSGRSTVFADYLTLFEYLASSDNDLALLADRLVSAFNDRSVFQTNITTHPLCGVLSLKGLSAVPDRLYGPTGRNLLKIIKTRHKLCEWLDSTKKASYAAVLRIDFAGEETEREVLRDTKISDGERAQALRLLQDMREKAAQYETLMMVSARRSEPDRFEKTETGKCVWQRAAPLLSNIDHIAQTGARNPREALSVKITKGFIRSAIMHGCLALKTADTVSVPTLEDKAGSTQSSVSGNFIFLPPSPVGINTKGLNELEIKPEKEEQACVILFDLICTYALRTYRPQGAALIEDSSGNYRSTYDDGWTQRARKASFHPVSETYWDDAAVFENIITTAVRFFTNLYGEYGWESLSKAVSPFANYPVYADLIPCLLPKSVTTEVLSDGENIYPAHLSSVNARYRITTNIFSSIPVAATAITDMDDAGWVMKTVQALETGQVLHTCHFEMLIEAVHEINNRLGIVDTTENNSAEFS